jgi:hypothetical protein
MTYTIIFYIGTAMSLSARRYSKGSRDEMKLVGSTKKRKKRGNTLEKKLVRNLEKHLFIHSVHKVDT